MSGCRCCTSSAAEPGGTITVAAAWSADGRGLRPGSRHATADLPGGVAGVRVDDLAGVAGPVAGALRAAGIGAVIGTPVVVDEREWGLLLGGQRAGVALGADVEERLAPFAGLVASRVGSMARRRELARLADEQASLRRVATLVARGVPTSELLAAMTREIGLLLDLDVLHLARYDEDGDAHGVASWSRHGNPIPLGTVTPDEGESIPSLVLRTGRQVRISNYEGVASPIAERLRALGTYTAVGVPLRVDGRLWGVLGAAAVDDRRLPDDVGDRIAEFSELLATAIGDLEAREARTRLHEEHEALRDIATLVAQDVAPGELFVEVAAAIGHLLDADFAALTPFVDDETWVAAAWSPRGDHPAIDQRFPIAPDTLAHKIRATGRPARVDVFEGPAGELTLFVRDVLGARSAVGAPIVVGGRVWGALIVHTTAERRLPKDTTARLESFGELVATAIGNSEARAELKALADEQAALRRVATLVAYAAPAEAVFAAVGRELGRLLWDMPTQVVRYDDDGQATVLAGWGDTITPAGQRVSLEGDSVSSLVKRAGAPVRISADQWSGPLGEYALSFGLRWGVGAPIMVDGRVWGAMTIVSRERDPFPADTEQRIARFADLVAAAISNLEARDALAASRARVVAAADDERRRVVSDLHDGAQQRLVHTIVTLKLALKMLDERPEEGREFVAEGLEQAEQATRELRDLVHGILPRVLTAGGLCPAVIALAARMTIPVGVDVWIPRVNDGVEAAAYFVVAEALTNVAKHAGATRAGVHGRIVDGMLQVTVRDDGAGGARPDGRGLLGLADRLAVLQGRLTVDSAPQRGTTVTATIPITEIVANASRGRGSMR